MGMSLQSIIELSVYPWENITGPGPLLNTSNFASPVAVPLFCQGYVTGISYFLEVHIVLFGGCSWFRLAQTLSFLHGSLYHDRFCLAPLWTTGICSVFCMFVFCFLSGTCVDWIMTCLSSWCMVLITPCKIPTIFFVSFFLHFYPYFIPTPISLPSW